MNEKDLLKGITINQWTNWENKAHVYYWNYSWSKKKELKNIINSVSPQTVFVNGIYSLYFNLLPVLYSLQTQGVRIIWSSRGMLHSGALAQKSLKKKLFFSLINRLKIPQRVSWHATDEQEASFIRQKMKTASTILIAGNYPNIIEALPILPKQKGSLVLGTIALISAMKNHQKVINALQNCAGAIKWIIYGPVKDEAYWKECRQLIQLLPPHIEVVYKGELQPTELRNALDEIQVFIMPSESENFGHAILEALSAAKPVITTNTTPFHALEQQQAGVAVDLKDITVSLTKAINLFTDMEAGIYKEFCNNATVVAREHVSESTLYLQYQTLFGKQH
jgi:glycosyltransferase involved in cell wall biosynthesis